MPTIHVARDGAKLGEFTLDQIRAGLETGQFRPSDLGWQTGMADWRPLREFVVQATASTAVALPTAAVPGTGLPWERRSELGFGKAWFETVSLLITRPSEAFTMMRPEGGLMDPLLFGLIGGCAGSIVSLIFQGLLQSIPGLSGRNNFFPVLGLGVWGPIIIYGALMPILIVLGLFVGSAVLHLCLMLVGGANRSFETTFRVACFTAGSANLFSMVPICGGFIAVVYQIVLECIGLSRAHQTTTGKALMAIFLPLLLCCVICLILGIVLGGFGAFSDFFQRAR
ncbi:MAG: YIP1 family protein [Chthoniobacterales bacterium]